MIESKVATTQISAIENGRTRRSTLAYHALVLFSAIYFIRPEDFIPGLGRVPIGKLAGGVALLALTFGVRAKARHGLPTELKILLLLLVQLTLSIPFAYW